MKAKALGELPWIDKVLDLLRKHGWKIFDSRAGLVIKAPLYTEIIYGTHLVTAEVYERFFPHDLSLLLGDAI